MYFENDRVSPKQIGRLIIVEFTGISILVSTRITGGLCGRDGLISIAYAAFFSAVFAILVLNYNNTHSGDFLENIENRFGRKPSCIVAILFGIKYFVCAVWIFELISVLIKKILLQHMNVYWILVPAVLIVLYGAFLKFEARCRFGEAAFYFVIIPVVILALITMKKCDVYNLTPLFMTGNTRTVLSALLLVVLCSPMEMLLFSGKHFSSNKGMKKSVCISILVIAIINILYFILNTGIYGIDNASGEEISSVMLMGAVGHLESATALFAIVSIYSLINCYICYIVKMLKFIFNKNRETESRRAGICFASVIAAAVAAGVLLTFGVPYKDTGNTIENCNIEDKMIVTTMAIDFVDNEYKVKYGLAHDENGKSVADWSGNDLRKTKQELGYLSDGVPDFSHIKVIILGSDILKSEDALEGVGAFINEDNTIPKNAVVACSETSAEEIMGIEEHDGRYIDKLLRNNVSFNTAEAYELVQNISDADSFIPIARLTYDGKYASCIGTTIINGKGTAVTLTINQTNILQMVKSEMSGKVVRLTGGAEFKVISNNQNVSLRIINNETIGVDIRLNGRIEDMSYAEDVEELNMSIEDDISQELKFLLEDCKIDYLNIYDRLSIKDRVMWAEYSGRRDRLYKKIYFNVSASYTVN